VHPSRRMSIQERNRRFGEGWVRRRWQSGAGSAGPEKSHGLPCSTRGWAGEWWPSGEHGGSPGRWAPGKNRVGPSLARLPTVGGAGEAWASPAVSAWTERSGAVVAPGRRGEQAGGGQGGG
jgi:hypothetical protein